MTNLKNVEWINIEIFCFSLLSSSLLSFFISFFLLVKSLDLYGVTV